MNLIAQNSIYEKIYIYTNNLDDKYKWLNYSITFDDLVFSNKKYLNFIVDQEN